MKRTVRKSNFLGQKLELICSNLDCKRNIEDGESMNKCEACNEQYCFKCEKKDLELTPPKLKANLPTDANPSPISDEKLSQRPLSEDRLSV